MNLKWFTGLVASPQKDEKINGISQFGRFWRRPDVCGAAKRP